MKEKEKEKEMKEKEWTHEEKVEEVQRWAQSAGFESVTFFPCGHVAVFDKKSFDLSAEKGCPFKGCHDSEGRAINP